MHIVDFGSYLPEQVVDLDSYEPDPEHDDPMAAVPLFGPPKLRRHVGDERASTMIERAALPMFHRIGVDPASAGGVDVLITNVLLPDQLFTGCGAETAHALGCRPEWIIDLHNGGCASFPYMLQLASMIIATTSARTALIANVQNSAGQVFSQPAIRRLPHARVPGDGCGVAYLSADRGAPLLGVRTRNTPAAALDLEPVTTDGRRFWAPGDGELDVRFDRDRTADTLALGNRIVPELVEELCEDLDTDPEDIDLLVTNQPNRIFLRNWRDALGIDESRHLDTFDQYGNLFGAGVPVTMDQAVRDGRVADGALVVLAGFAHAGDFAAAAAVRWTSG